MLSVHKKKYTKKNICRQFSRGDNEKKGEKIFQLKKRTQPTRSEREENSRKKESGFIDIATLTTTQYRTLTKKSK